MAPLTVKQELAPRRLSSRTVWAAIEVYAGSAKQELAPRQLSFRSALTAIEVYVGNARRAAGSAVMLL